MEDVHDRMFWMVPNNGDTSKSVNICDVDNFYLKRITDRIYDAWDRTPSFPVYVQRWRWEGTDKKEVSELNYMDFGDLEDYVKEIVRDRKNMKRTCTSCRNFSKKHGNILCSLIDEREDVHQWIKDNSNYRTVSWLLPFPGRLMGGIKDNADNCPGFFNPHYFC
jgi:hypothetical protein